MLKGYDKLDNLVLDDCIEFIRGNDHNFLTCCYHLTCFATLSDSNPTLYYQDPNDPFKLSDQTRRLGLVVCRGTHVSLISPAEGMEEIANPFEDEFAEEEA